MMIEQDTANRIKKVIRYLNEHQRRIYLAAEAEAMGRGEITAISGLMGVYWNTISARMKELRSCEESQNDKIVSGHVRRKGGGRKSVEQSQQGNADALDRLADDSSYGKPENPLRWTTKKPAEFGRRTYKRGLF